MSEETQPLTGAQALHAAQVMERMNEEARDLLLVTNMDVARIDLDAARAALLSRLGALRVERDALRAKLEKGSAK